MKIVQSAVLGIAVAVIAVVASAGTTSARPVQATQNAACGSFSNATDTPTANNSSVYVPVYVSGCFGSPSATSTVDVDIVHPNRGDLTLDLVAYDGTEYRLKNSNFLDWRSDVHATYTVDLSGEQTNAPWFLKVTDTYTGATGYVDSWSLSL